MPTLGIGDLNLSDPALDDLTGRNCCDRKQHNRRDCAVSRDKVSYPDLVVHPILHYRDASIRSYQALQPRGYSANLVCFGAQEKPIDRTEPLRTRDYRVIILARFTIERAL